MTPEVGIMLRASHLVMDEALASGLFKDAFNALISYKIDRKVLLVSPDYNGWFAKMHSSSTSLLKAKDRLGTRAVSIRQIILDYELDDSDRVLPYQYHRKQEFVKIELQ